MGQVRLQVERHSMSTMEIAPLERAEIAPAHGLMPVLTIHQAVQRYNQMVEFTQTIMVKDQDYGTIQGVAKPCLYKAGAEKLTTLFGLTPAFTLIERVEDWTGKDHGEPFFFYFYKCTLMRGGEAVGEADGSCNSWEKKYRYREGKRKCPHCGAEAIINGKKEYGGGFLCYGKKGGCGAKFKDGDVSITGQDVGVVTNPDIAEVVNTIQKMAQKRALVAAVLIACNASAFYTQDVEDLRAIEADYEDVTETSEQVRERRLAEERAKAAKPAHVPASNGPATSPETIRELGAMLETPPTIQEYEQRSTAKAAEAKEATKREPKSKAPIPVSVDMLKAFGEIKGLLNAQTGSDVLYYQVLEQAGYKKSNQIPTRDEGSKVYKMLGAALTRIRAVEHNREEIVEIQATMAPERFADALFEAGVGNDLDKISGDDLLRVLEVLRAAATK